MQIKARKRYQVTSDSLATKTKTKTQKIRNVGKDVKKLEASCPAIGDVSGTSWKKELPYNPAIPLTGIYT